MSVRDFSRFFLVSVSSLGKRDFLTLNKMAFLNGPGGEERESIRLKIQFLV